MGWCKAQLEKKKFQRLRAASQKALSPNVCNIRSNLLLRVYPKAERGKRQTEFGGEVQLCVTEDSIDLMAVDDLTKKKQAGMSEKDVTKSRALRDAWALLEIKVSQRLLYAYGHG